MHAYFMRGKATPQRPADGALALRFSNPMLGIMDDLERPVVDGLLTQPVTRRRFVHSVGAAGALAGLQRLAPAYSLAVDDRSLEAVALEGVKSIDKRVDLIIDRTPFAIATRRGVHYQSTTLRAWAPDQR